MCARIYVCVCVCVGFLVDLLQLRRFLLLAIQFLGEAGLQNVNYNITRVGVVISRGDNNFPLRFQNKLIQARITMTSFFLFSLKVLRCLVVNLKEEGN